MNNLRITEKDAEQSLKNGYQKAEELLNNEDKIERFLQRLEKKLQVIPLAGERLKTVPILASLLRSYVKKEYADIPIGSIIAITSALIYFVSPIDIIPDTIPVAGYVDDAMVIAACWKMVESDVEEYEKWRSLNNKKIDQ